MTFISTPSSTSWRSLAFRSLPLQSLPARRHAFTTVFLLAAIFWLFSGADLRAQVETEVPNTSDSSGPFHVGKITFYGHSRTREAVLRQVLGIYEGEVFNLSRVRTGIGRLQSVVDIKSEESIELDPDPGTRQVDLRIHLVEKDVFYPEGGGGYSQVDGWSGRLSFGARNAFGFAESFVISARDGQFQQSFRLSASVPGLFDGTYDTSVQLFDDQLDYDFPDSSTHRSRRGLGLQLRRRTSDLSQVSVTYRSTSVEDRDGIQTFEPFGSSFTESAIDFGYTWDSHGRNRSNQYRQNQQADPRSGKRLRLGLAASGGPLGGEVSSFLPRLGVSSTHTLSEGFVASSRLTTLLRTNLEATWIEPLSRTSDGLPSISSLDRFYLGGPNTLRGYGQRSVWLRDATTGESIRDANNVVRGGDGSLLANLELHLIPDGPVRFVLFADGGRLFTNISQKTFGLRASVGIELQLRVPRLDVPLRFIWAENLTPLPSNPTGGGERFEQLSFGIGLSF